MNVCLVRIIAMTMHTAITQLDPIIAHATMDTKEQASIVQVMTISTLQVSRKLIGLLRGKLT